MALLVVAIAAMVVILGMWVNGTVMRPVHHLSMELKHGTLAAVTAGTKEQRDIICLPFVFIFCFCFFFNLLSI